MSVQDERETLVEALRALEAARGALGGQYEPLRAAAEEKIRRLDSEQVRVGERGVGIGGDAKGNVIFTGDLRLPEDAGPEQLLKAYLAALANECSQLPLAVIDTQFADGGERVGLAEVYVELDATSAGRPAEAEDERDWAWRLARGEAAGRTPVREVLARREARRHVLLGDPGSGKTTLAQQLCRSLATEPPEGLTELLPVRFVLREVVARHLPADAERGTAGMLWSALGAQLEACLGPAAAERLLPFVQRRLLDTGGFVVLDGLDEVPEAGERRRVLLETVQALAAELGDASRFLVTARPYAYADPRWHLDGFDILALAPFSEEQVDRFIDGWYNTAARRAFRWSEAVARDKADQLRGALKGRRDLGDLASRPLLLTLMATLHSSWGQLPQDRADLYEETVKLLLGRWQRGAKPEMTESLAHEDRLRGALETLALDVHTRQGAEKERDDHPADISRGEVLVAFEKLLGEVQAAELLGYLEDRAGLLIQRREGTWAFPHRSFQEYLAACRLTSLDDPPEQFQRRVFEDPAWWREVALLGIGRARRHGLGTAMGYLSELLPDGPANMESVVEEHWHAAVLCGQALFDMKILDTDDAERPQPKVHLGRVREWLRRLVEEGRLSPKDRLEAGDVLGRLGDPRPGVAAIEWVEIPAGSFWMGSSEDDSLALDWERPRHELHLDGFRISRYPITNAQFRPFVEGDGYSTREYWTDAGWEWLQGAEVDVSVYPEKIREDAAKWLARRPKEKRRRPFFWDDDRLAAPTRPIVGVTWYEALAFSRWLTARIAELPGLPVKPAGCRVGLPSEAQWEKAARGTEKATIWPWGPEFEAGSCNSSEAELEETSPVGIFPRDRSPYGVRDMAGNVWEWTISSWGPDAQKPHYGYPCDGADGREKLDGKALCIVRGGSFYDDKQYARCAARSGLDPANFDDCCGFRVVLSLAVSDC